MKKKSSTVIILLVIAAIAAAYYLISRKDYHMKKPLPDTKIITVTGQIKGSFDVRVGDEVLYELDPERMVVSIAYKSEGDRCVDQHRVFPGGDITRIETVKSQEVFAIHHPLNLDEKGFYRQTFPEKIHYRGCDWKARDMSVGPVPIDIAIEPARYDIFCQKYLFHDDPDPLFVTKDCESETKNALSHSSVSLIIANIKISDDVQCLRCPDWSPYKHLSPYDPEFKVTPGLIGTFEESP